MALINCPECGKQVSDAASACPHCGHPIRSAAPAGGTAPQAKNPTGNNSAGCFAIGCLAVIVAAVAFGVCATDHGGSSSKSDLAGPKTTISGFAVCTTLEAMKRVVELANDRLAYARYIADPSNGCALLKPNLSVTVEDYAMGGYVKIRMTGYPYSMWVVKEAIGVQ